MQRILITSVGSLVGHNILSALEPVRSRVFVIGVEVDPGQVNNFRCDAAYLAPPIGDAAAFKQRLIEIVQGEGVSLVLSGTDTDLPVLAQLGEEAGSGTTFLVPRPRIVEICGDKYRTFRFARECGLPFVETATEPDEVKKLWEEYGGPLICKARRGSGSQAAFVVRDPEEAQAAVENGSFVFQPILGDLDEVKDLLGSFRYGVPLSASIRSVQYSAQFLFGIDGSQLGYIATEVTMEAGKSVRCTTLRDDRLDALALRWGAQLARLGHRGPLNIQCKRLSDGQYVPFELNARFTGQTGARPLLGFNELRVALAHLLGLESGDDDGPTPFGRYVVRIPTSYALDISDVDALAGDRHWTRDCLTNSTHPDLTPVSIEHGRVSSLRPCGRRRVGPARADAIPYSAGPRIRGRALVEERVPSLPIVEDLDIVKEIRASFSA